MHELGVRISLDDFGTGYSSIGYLRSFRFDKLKIDQSFVKDLLADERSLAIVRAIVGLGTSFGITTTAEGVETEDQKELPQSGRLHRSAGIFVQQATASPTRSVRFSENSVLSGRLERHRQDRKDWWFASGCSR